MEPEVANRKSEFRNPNSLWLLLGLGNPGADYAETLHNAGFRVLDRLALEHGVRMDEWFSGARISKVVMVGGQTAVLVLPQTFMNRSGIVLPPLFERFNTGIDHTLVVYDDLALPLGKIRVRRKGSAGGHNGLKSIISITGSEEFMRVRVGIGTDRQIDDVRDFVLSPVAAGEQKLLSTAEETAARAVETLLGEGIDKAMGIYNGIDLRAQSMPKHEEP